MSFPPTVVLRTEVGDIQPCHPHARTNRMMEFYQFVKTFCSGVIRIS